MKRVDFGTTKTGEKCSKYIFANAAGLEVEFSDFGALILALRVPDRNGDSKDVILGYDTMAEYYDNDCGFGAYIGRNGNRIGGACVTLDGVEYSLETNDNGNNLHSGSNRSHYQFYQAKTGENEEGSFVEFERVSPHLEQGFPGNLKQKLRYTLTDRSELILDYEMESDMTTVVNPTNHAYFNLAGHDSGDILSHEMEIYADSFLPTDEELIPTGEIASVEGTPMDFRKAKAVGLDIDSAYLPLEIAGGYDHNYVFANDGRLKPAAKLYSAQSGIFMKVFTDLCGMQVYSGNFLDGAKGKNGAVYEKRNGICFETQFYPNACKQPGFPSSVLAAGKVFRSRTVYQFGIEK
ncbi:MAG: galactose mutarotase [Lachnospiraceae bacterium]|nr:galactose mutarotase [Lachnospiraceae bacterium]